MLQDAFTESVTVKIVDKDPDAGPFIQIYNANGTPVSGVVDAYIVGY